MSTWERDPEGQTLAWLAINAPSLDREIEVAMAYLDERPSMLFALENLSARQRKAVAYAYNNLMALYSRGEVRIIDPDRLVRMTPLAARVVNAACDTHTADYLFVALQQRFVTWSNTWTTEADRAYAYIPHNMHLRSIMRVFEHSLDFPTSLRLGQIVGVTSDNKLMVTYRSFASIEQYQRYEMTFDRNLFRQQTIARRRLGCARCCPCVATATLSLLPNHPDIVISYGAEAPHFFPEWFRLETAISSADVRRYATEDIQNAIKWFFSGTSEPLALFFRVAASLLRPDDPDVGNAVAIVQEVIIKAYRALRDYPETSKTRQQNYILPALHAGRLYDPLTDAMVTPLRRPSGYEMR